MPPIRVMTTDRTVAKIGRSMKKRDIKVAAPLYAWQVLAATAPLRDLI